MRRRLWLLALAWAVFAGGASLAQYEATAGTPVRPARARLLRVPPGVRVLVVAPHPDDEVLAAGVLIQRVRAAGGEVRVVFVTSGDAYRAAGRKALGKGSLSFGDFRALGDLRQREARKALAALGVSPAEAVFLGFPDKGLAVLWRERWDRPYRSPATGVSAVPYRGSYLPGAPYEGQQLVRLLREVMRAFRPDWVVAPGVMDLHPDHQATALFVRLAWAEEQRRGLLLEYAVHRRAWHLEPWGESMPLPRKALWASRGGSWVRLDPAGPEARRKHRAIMEYASQVRVMGGFLLPYASSPELFRVVGGEEQGT